MASTNAALREISAKRGFSFLENALADAGNPAPWKKTMPDASLQLTLAGADDIAALLPLIEEFYRHESIPFDGTAIRGALQQVCTNPNLGQIWLARDGVEVAGYLVLVFGFILEFGGRQIFIDELYVRPGFQRRGYGRTMLAWAETIARKMGIAVLRLEVARTNEHAWQLYLKSGFEPHDRTTMTKLLQ